jgi:hypothetical protein
MATKNEIIYDIREGLSKYSDDSNIDDRYIIHKVNTVRNKLLTQSLNNFKGIKGKNVLQSFCTKLEQVDSSTCGEFSCGTILKSELKMPETLQLVSTQTITRIKPVDILSKKISFINLDRMEFIDGTSFPNSLYGFLDVDNYMYVYSPKGDYQNMSCVEITGIFANPMELENYAKCCDCPTSNICFDPEIDNYPVFDYMINDIVSIVTQQILAKENIPLDRENNSDDD